MNNDGRYVQFAPKTDGTNEVISAEHINTLQDVSERTQQGIFKAQDRDFLDKALFVLEHHRVMNAMWLDLFEDTSKVNLRKSTGVVFSETEQGISLLDGYTLGELYSVVHQNINGANIKNVLIIGSGYAPQGTGIKLSISNNGTDWTAVDTSSDAVITLPTDGTYIIMRAVLTRNEETDESPRLDAWAVLYKDPANDIIKLPDGGNINLRPEAPGEDGGEDSEGGSGSIGGGGFGDIINIMHSQLMGVGPDDHHAKEHTHNGLDGSGLVSHTDLTDIGEDDHHSKNHKHGEDGIDKVDLTTDVTGSLPVENLSHQLWTGKPGSTGLYFDPDIGDKLVYVKTPDDETYMFYDLVADRLSHTITIVLGIAVWEQMHFAPYTTSTGETTIVLAGTEKTHYDATDPLILNEIAKIAAPAKPLGVVATNAGLGGTIVVTWQPSPEFDLAGYNIYMSANNGTTWTLQNTSGVLTSPIFTKTGLVNGIPYLFRVAAIDIDGYVSDYSATAKAIPSMLDTTPPLTVSNITAVRINPGEVRLEWSPSTEPDFKEYTILQSATGTPSGYTPVHTINAALITSVNITGLTPLGTYYFIVTATDLSNNTSPPSTVVSVIA